MLTVYLAGGMRSDWQTVVRKACPRAIYIDPRYHGLDIETEYTAWDRLAIERSDLVFAYLEESNPSGAGLAFEVGYAVALGKTVIFVEEYKTPNRYFGMVRASSVYAQTLVVGIELLKTFTKLD